MNEINILVYSPGVVHAPSLPVNRGDEWTGGRPNRIPVADDPTPPGLRQYRQRWWPSRLWLPRRHRRRRRRKRSRLASKLLYCPLVHLDDGKDDEPGSRFNGLFTGALGKPTTARLCHRVTILQTLVVHVIVVEPTTILYIYTYIYIITYTHYNIITLLSPLLRLCALSLSLSLFSARYVLSDYASRAAIALG